MYFMYVDESGVPELRGGTDHFVLLGLAIPADQWSAYSRQIAVIKSGVDLLGKEIHAAWMARRYHEQEQIPDFEKLGYDDRRNQVRMIRARKLTQIGRNNSAKKLRDTRKLYRKTENYIHLTRDERLGVLKDLIITLRGWQDCRLFGEAIRKHNYPYDKPFLESFKLLVHRFESFLCNRGRHLGEDLRGILIQDNNDTQAKRVTQLMRTLYSEGTFWKDVNKIVETPFFVNSELTEFVQLADLCAYVTRRFFESNETDLFNLIYPRFDRAGTAVVGLRHFTASNTCNCQVCRDHSGQPEQADLGF